MKDTYPVSPCRQGKGQRRPTPQNTTVVVSRWNADTSWTQKLAEMGYRVCVYDHGTNPNNPFNLPDNVGLEMSAYTKYTRDYYDNLTLYTVFVHDEEHSWHHEGSLVDLIVNKVSNLCSPKYVNFNNRCTGGIYDNPLWKDMTKYFDRYLAPYIGSRKQYGNWTLGNRCCAQFIVHRDRIRKHPRKMYEDLYKFAITTQVGQDKIGNVSAHLFEWTAALVFDSPVLYPNPSKKKLTQKDEVALNESFGGPCAHSEKGIKSKGLGMVR